MTEGELEAMALGLVKSLGCDCEPTVFHEDDVIRVKHDRHCTGLAIRERARRVANAWMN